MRTKNGLLVKSIRSLTCDLYEFVDAYVRDIEDIYDNACDSNDYNEAITKESATVPCIIDAIETQLKTINLIMDSYNDDDFKQRVKLVVDSQIKLR